MPGPEGTPGSKGRTALIVLAAAVVVGLAASGQTYFMSLGFGRAMPPERAVAMGLRDWLVWALFVPLIWKAVAHYPVERPHIARDLIMHVAFAAGFAILFEMFIIGAERSAPQWFGFPRRRDWPEPDVSERLWWGLSRRFVVDFLIYGALALTGRLRTLYQRVRERERTELALRSSLGEARIQALKMQLQPHFLFNTLNAISALIHKDPVAADLMLGELSDLLRSALDAPEQQTLAAELQFLDRYLGIQQKRFGDRLRVVKRIDDEALLLRVPAMILQPLVENAIRHGIEQKLHGGVLEVYAALKNNHLELVVSDDGGHSGGEWKEGIGLRNTRARLLQHFGPDHRLEIVTNGDGSLVRILLPFSRSNARKGGAEDAGFDRGR